ncbi:hypothetical protein R0K04_29670, partial [Pseudoalteromonas sp. SIMBA_153]
MAALPELGSLAPVGMSTEDYSNVIANELKDTSKQAIANPANHYPVNKLLLLFEQIMVTVKLNPYQFN